MGFVRNFDWWTVLIYVILALWGWLSINAATYQLDDSTVWESLFDFNRQSGKQIVWFSLAIFLIVVILMVDVKTYMVYAPVVYFSVMCLLFATIFIGTNINGSHSWIKIGSFSIQPAEFGKFSTALMLAWLFQKYDFHFNHLGDFVKACAVILIPVILIIMQRETGSALVYFSLALLFYRQGMSGIVLWGGFCAILIFVLGVKYSVEPLPPGVVLREDESAPTSLYGQSLVLTIIPFLIATMMAVYARQLKSAGVIVMVAFVVYGVLGLINRYVALPFHFEFRWVGWVVCTFSVLYCVWIWLKDKVRESLMIGVIGVLFVAFLYSVDFAFTRVLEPHQRGRIEVLLGMKEDLRGAGYNVNQAKIAIGSGGLTGKGYLEGTQTKLAYVPEQETDFIFCTIGEEHGFVGSLGMLLLYGALLLRLISLAERQKTKFAQVYGYCVVSIIAFHVMINMGMVIGLVPVIGIPLPLVSYGGSGLWSFTILLFIFLKLDSEHLNKY